MLQDIGVEDRVARELYPVALQQARSAAFVQSGVVTALLAVWFVLGFSRGLAMGSILVPGLIATVRDVRWWLWLRHADPIEANRRLEEREELGAHPALPRGAAAAVLLFTLWWFAGR